MWDDILEIVLEGILEISIDAAGHKGKGILIGLATLAWLAVIALLLWVGIAESDITLIGSIEMNARGRNAIACVVELITPILSFK